ncbi:MAG: heme biosynthesis protein HemY [Rhizobiales bacterium 62-47]|nr:heme biosynthesis protein HemY [Hyphomicrobiales bacterium]OJY13058.1 MAG: heme biosynthesis protein HemY [Rhizobiales bacterium 62-47]
MLRIILFLLLIAIAALVATWVGDQSGDVALTWSGWRIETSLPVFVLLVGLVSVAAIIAWSLVRGIWRAPHRVRRARHERRQARGRRAVTQGLLAIGQGDSIAARKHAGVAKRLATEDPLALLLHAQSAQMDGDRDGAQRAFRAMAQRKDTRLLGLRGLFIEAQRADDPVAAVEIAEEALKLAPSSSWASHAVLGFRCAKADWPGALTILDNNLAAGLLDKASYQRQRAVLLTARALELEGSDRDVARHNALEAARLAPTLVPAATLAGKLLSEAHQVRRAMRIIEAAWTVNPHPDLADVYAHVKLGDSARQRLARVEALAAKAPGHLESAVALARAAIDASEFGRAREALAPFVAAPTQRVAMLMAEIERTEHGDSGRAREWTLRAVRALHDPVWTADGYVSDRWRPVSPVTGQLDAFQWQMPLAALPSEHAVVVEPEPVREPLLAPPRAESAEADAPVQPGDAPVAAEEERGAQMRPESAAPVSTAPPPVFRARQDMTRKTAAPIPPVIPIVRAPDDPGVDEDSDRDEFDGPATKQAGGWRGFVARWVG